MQFTHLADELLPRRRHIQGRLARLWVGEESDEIHRVTGAQRDADLRVVFESADTWSVTSARIDDDVGTALWIDGDTFAREDAQQRVVDWALELARIQHDFVFEMKHRRFARPLMFE